MAVVGDNPGASNDPEVIAPLSKLQKMLPNMGGNDVNVSGQFRIAGTDLLLTLERAERDAKRSRGY